MGWYDDWCIEMSENDETFHWTFSCVVYLHDPRCFQQCSNKKNPQVYSGDSGFYLAVCHRNIQERVRKGVGEQLDTRGIKLEYFTSPWTLVSESHQIDSVISGGCSIVCSPPATPACLTVFVFILIYKKKLFELISRTWDPTSCNVTSACAHWDAKMTVQP